MLLIMPTKTFPTKPEIYILRKYRISVYVSFFLISFQYIKKLTKYEKTSGYKMKSNIKRTEVLYVLSCIFISVLISIHVFNFARNFKKIGLIGFGICYLEKFYEEIYYIRILIIDSIIRNGVCYVGT